MASSALKLAEGVRSKRCRSSRFAAQGPTDRGTNRVKEMASSRRQTVQLATDDMRRFWPCHGENRERGAGTQ